MERNGLETVEEAVQLLRCSGERALLPYLLGAVPFLLVLLFFCRDMSAGYREARCLPESALCVAAFVWMSFWNARFAGTLYAALAGETGEAKRSSWFSCLTVQATLQSAKLFVLPLVIIAVFPIAWVSAFFRAAHLAADQPGCTGRGVMRSAALHASASVRQNWWGLAVLSLLSIVVFANVLALMITLPFLSKILTGYENEWTRNAGRAFNAQTLFTALAVTWFLMNPLLQAFSAVRCFYADARADGRDLLVSLRRMAALLIVAASLLGVRAQAAQTVSSQELEHSVGEVLKGEEYGWTRPPEAAFHSGGLLQRLNDDIAAAWKQVRAGAIAFNAWLKKLLKLDQNDDEPDDKKRGRSPQVAWIIYAAIGVLAFTLLLTAFRRRAKPPEVDAGDSGQGLAVDATNEHLLATELPDEEWLRLAREYLRKGESRLAARALYLSNLSYLGQLQLLLVTKAKSNRLYEKELRLHSRAQSLWEAFALVNRSYEKSWYGLHQLSTGEIDSLQEQVDAIRAYAKA